tara:strand:+ start:1368 stop:1589 length:222 start_codon:yes stop_codon:yes gene_type:complete
MDDPIELIPVEGHNSLGRDPQSNAIINTDVTAYEAYRRARKDARRKEKELNELKGEVAELKELVNKLVQNADK